MSFWEQFSDKKDLIKQIKASSEGVVLDVNAHLHTPYSFSAFSSVNQAVEFAVGQGVKVIGINDFYSTSGFASWAKACTNSEAFPLFNIEFVGLSKPDQEKGIRINDPNNPGRIYISGKGLSFPFRLEEPYYSQLENLQQGSNTHVGLMCEKLNAYFAKSGLDMQLDFKSILHTHTKGLIRERHLAQVVREEVFKAAGTDKDRKILLEKIYGGKAMGVAIDNNAALENEIRNNLLKAGGHAFVPENPELFLSVENIREIILKGGGIPTYPVLADDKNGHFTEFEGDKVQLADELKKRGFYSVELITIRNSPEVLEEYATWFRDNGFIVTFGSEHNAPGLSPVLLYTRDGAPLNETLRKINYQGACLIAAHQYLMASQGTGYLNEKGAPFIEKISEYHSLGHALITNFLTK